MKKVLLFIFLFAGFTAFSQINLQNGLIAHFPFNGNANDESGNQNNGSTTGATLTVDRFGNPNKAFNFDGIDDKITLPTSILNNLSQLTFSAWVKCNPYTGTNWPSVLGSYSEYNISNNICLGLWRNSQHLHIEIDTDQGNYGGEGELSINWNEWTHIVMTYNGQYLTEYINGIKGKSYPATGNLSQMYSFTIGQVTYVNPFFNGSIDDIRIYNRAINEQEINSLYNENICTQTITVTDTLIINTNITNYNPITFRNTIKIYPNPTKDILNIDFGNFSSMAGYSLKILNSLNQTVYTTTITKQNEFISMSMWNKGLYFVHLIDNNGHTLDVKKIVLQ